MHFVPSLENIPARLLSSIADADCRGVLCPDVKSVFRAFQITPLNNVKVVILGQDPYHTEGKASGLAFGYHKDYKGPLDSSLFNITSEILNDTGQEVQDLTLESLAKQGVLLLNTRLTTEIGKPLSHKDEGWEEVIPYFIERLGDTTPPHVYMLWGREAQQYKRYINTDYNLVLEASHPCRFSAHISFSGCKHFSKANDYLRKHNREAIRWGVEPDKVS